jgi:hypothetical protein
MQASCRKCHTGGLSGDGVKGPNHNTYGYPAEDEPNDGQAGRRHDFQVGVLEQKALRGNLDALWYGAWLGWWSFSLFHRCSD